MPVAVWRGDDAGSDSHTTLLAVVRDGVVVPTTLDYVNDAERSAVDDASTALADKVRRARELTRSGAGRD